MPFVFLVFAFVLFVIGASSRWWSATGQPYFPSIVSAGLAFWVLAAIWPMLPHN